MHSFLAFNIALFLDAMPSHEFCFPGTDIPKIAAVINLPNGKTRRRGYIFDLITSFCIVLKIISLSCNWMDLEAMFGIPILGRSETLWETIERFFSNNGHIVTMFKSKFIR